MKKLLLLSAIAVFGFSNVNAQEEGESTKGFAKGDIFLTGSLSYGSESQGDDKESAFGFSPKAAYFVTENIAVGINLGYTTTKVEALNVDDIKTNMLEAGVFGRYYLTPAKQFSVFGELGANYATGNQDNGTVDVDTNGFNIGFAPGISYFVSDCIALEASFGVLSYETSELDVNGAESKDSFDFGLNLSDISFGMVYKF